MHCPTCASNDINKTGMTRHGNQNYNCRDCRRQFVENPKWRRIRDEGTGSAAWELEKPAEKGLQELDDQAEY
ncbi:MAG: hypothetical protein NT070_23700 [Cyanobacteria bacterium]|nr:hypothetical protein [Cyanobacteriota bacterium]